MITSKCYGWKRQLPDARDHKFSVTAPIDLPPIVDLRPQCPPVYDQGELGSCTANALAAAFQFDLRKQGLADFTPSRLMIYYCERVIEHTIKSDAGAEIRDGAKVLAKTGAAPETLWPYDVKRFAQKPPAKAYSAAKKHLATIYASVQQTEIDICSTLAEGFPVVCGFTVYESFESQDVAQTGIVKMPAKSESVVGGHAVMIVGYDELQRQFIVRNSWGAGWGQSGYFMMPFEYLLSVDLASDFWVIQSVE